MTKRITITFDEEEYAIFETVNSTKKDSTKAKQIIMAYLYEKTFVKDASMKNVLKLRNKK